MNTEVIQKRFNEFKSRCSQLFGPKNDGYEELDTLERPLVSDVDNPLYEASEDGAYAPPGSQNAAHHRHASSNIQVPSQQEELELLTVLSTDAAEILWEMELLKEEEGAAEADIEEMRARSEQLRAQLRGMLNDYDGSDEVLMCRALEAWDSLNSALDGREGEGTPANDLLGGFGEGGEGGQGGEAVGNVGTGSDGKADEDGAKANGEGASGSGAKLASGPSGNVPSQDAAPNLIDF
jgi:hypothetical protein